jgi:hypothetical protein
LRYTHVPPRAERHEVNWYRASAPGIYAADRPFFSSLVLHPELVAWLDENAAGWSFRSDWDYSNAGDDDEGCHLVVPSREAADGFIGVADAMSKAWIAADRARMRHTLVLEVPGVDAIEIERSHHVADGLNHERLLGRHLVLDRQPMRARIFRAIRDAAGRMGGTSPATDGFLRVDVALEEDDVVVPDTRLAFIRTEAQAA